MGTYWSNIGLQSYNIKTIFYEAEHSVVQSYNHCLSWDIEFGNLQLQLL